MSDDPSEDQCASTRTVQVGPLAAIDLRCTLARWGHREPEHRSSRRFGDVLMTARWDGAFEESE